MSRTRAGRDALIAALNLAMRDSSGQGVLFSQAVAGRLGIASSDLECLSLVAQSGSLPAGALAEATGLTTGAITGVIDRLERAGYVRREADPKDRRKVMVRALAAVASRVAPLFAPMERAQLAALRKYSDSELTVLLEFFRRAHEGAIAATAELEAMAPKTRAHIRSVPSKKAPRPRK